MLQWWRLTEVTLLKKRKIQELLVTLNASGDESAGDYSICLVMFSAKVLNLFCRFYMRIFMRGSEGTANHNKPWNISNCRKASASCELYIGRKFLYWGD